MHLFSVNVAQAADMLDVIAFIPSPVSDKL